MNHTPETVHHLYLYPMGHPNAGEICHDLKTYYNNPLYDETPLIYFGGTPIQIAQQINEWQKEMRDYAEKTHTNVAKYLFKELGLV